MENLRVFLSNMWNWRTAWAYRHLARELNRDVGFARSWQANIAMPIYDFVRRRQPECSTECYPILSANECNDIADLLMEHLFGVKKSEQEELYRNIDQLK